MFNSWILIEFHSHRNLMSTSVRLFQRCQASKLTVYLTHEVMVVVSASNHLCRGTKE